MADRSGSRPVRLFALLAVALTTTGVAVAAVVSPILALTAAALDRTQSLNAAVPAGLLQVRLPQTSTVLAADGSVIAHFYQENRTEVPLSRISPWLQKAVVAVEDSRFYQHGAIDPRGVVRALVHDASGGSLEGGSTLTQQYVKNLLLEQAAQAGDPVAVQAAERAAVARTPARKLRELRIAVALEGVLTKQQILQGYLNIVYFGQGSYGAQAAAERYFATPAASLSPAQAALLAGLVQDPVGFDPTVRPAAARGRRDLVLHDMLTQGLLTAAQYAAARSTPVRVTGSPVPNGCTDARGDGFFCDYVIRTIETDPAFAALGRSVPDRRRALDTGGLVIRSTLDPAAQAAQVAAVERRVPATDPSGLAAAAVTVRPGTGEVVAMGQDRPYSPAAGGNGTSVNYSTDSTLGGSSGFQTGSAFKPFTLATWLEAGNTLAQTVDATKRAFPFSDFTSCGRRLSGTAPYVPGNSEGTETGRMSVLRATADSVNVAYVDMESRLDLCAIADTAARLGVHLAAPQQVCSRSARPSTQLPTCLPSLTLGVEDISPLTMAAAYAAFADGGVYCTPIPIRSITSTGTDTAGSTSVRDPGARCTQAITPQAASGVNQALRHVLTDGTAASVGPLPDWQSAGKTGTTDGPFDTWFVGYTSQLSTAVWVADPGHAAGGGFSRRRLTDITVDGRRYGTVFGASIAAPIWKDAMTTAMQGLPAQPLP